MKFTDTTAPLLHALTLLSEGGAARFHMPGHKGEPVFPRFADIFAIDYTETYGTGNLYTGEGPIRAAETAAARWYRADDCYFLTGGSTQGVLTMLASVPMGGSVLIDRNCHKSVCTGLALLDLTPHFVDPPVLEPFGIPAALEPDTVEAALSAHPEVSALLVTSPNYYGIRQDIPALAEVCRRHGKRLLIDGAHAAHFPAVHLPSPVAEGADCAVLSAHKTLPALGQSAYLIFRNTMDGAALREATALFGTSSPSYPVMASLDLARAWGEGAGADAFRKSAHECAALRRFVMNETPFMPLTESHGPLDPCRLTVCTAGTDLTGEELADALYDGFSVACEMADARNAVFILTGADNTLDLLRLRNALSKVGERAERRPLPAPLAPAPAARRRRSVREAWFAPRETIPLAAALGRVCARPLTPYPPGVPLVYPGEEIGAAQIEFLAEKCYNKIEVMRE